VDGQGQTSNDSVSESILFDATHPNRVLFDLRGSILIGAIRTYSWYVNSRSLQRYNIWYSNDLTPPASDGSGNEYLETAGWIFLADLDTPNPPNVENQIAVSMQGADPNLPLMTARYVLLDIIDPYMFYGEVDIVEWSAP